MKNQSEKFESAKIVTEVRDGLENLVAQLGTAQDKRANSKYVNSRRLSAQGNEQELNALYRTNWLAGKVVDIVAEDMTREWRDFEGDIKPEIIEMLIDEETRLGLRGAFEEATKWSRLYGTSFIVLSVDDGLNPDKPLDVDNLKEGSLKHIKVIDRHQIDASEQIPTTNPLDPNFGLPEYYRFKEASTRIHHTRMIRFDAVRLPFDELRRNNYFSDSVLDRLYDAITNFDTAANSAASMIYETNVDVVKVKGLMRYLESSAQETLLRKRFALASQLKSFNNMLLMDQEEDFNTKHNSFSGLPDLLDRFGKFLAAASDIVATRLLGTSASGLNATGEGDLKNYYDMLRSKQNSIFRPKLDYIDKIIVKHLGLDVNQDYTYSFKSLFQITPKEQSEIDLNNANRDRNYYDMSVISESQIAKELLQNKTYTNITDDDIKELEKLEEELEDVDDDPKPNTKTIKNENEPGEQEGEQENT